MSLFNSFNNDIQIGDFLSLCLEPVFQTVSVFDIIENKTLYTGDLEDTPEELQRMVIQSWDYISNDCIITFNVDSEYEKDRHWVPEEKE